MVSKVYSSLQLLSKLLNTAALHETPRNFADEEMFASIIYKPTWVRPAIEQRFITAQLIKVMITP